MFIQTTNGANASTALYSIVETANANGLIPSNYIMKCLGELCQAEPNIESLLPWELKNMEVKGR